MRQLKSRLSKIIIFRLIRLKFFRFSTCTKRLVFKIITKFLNTCLTFDICLIEFHGISLTFLKLLQIVLLFFIGIVLFFFNITEIDSLTENVS